MPVPAQIRRRALRQGDTGPLVRAWQQLLAAKGFVLAVDGRFGPKTLNATRVAQHWAGVTADGLVGPITWAAVEQKQRTPRPLPTVKALLGIPKVIDARAGRAGFPVHPTRRWDLRPASAIRAVVGHYTGGPGSFLGDARFHVESDYLTKGGAPAIAYHLGVDKDGTLFVFNDWQSVCWHCDGGHNTDTLGLVFRGGSEGPTLAQQRTLKTVLAELAAGTFRPLRDHPTWPRIPLTTTHRHVRATSCPGELGEAFYRANPAGRFVTSLATGL